MSASIQATVVPEELSAAVRRRLAASSPDEQEKIAHFIHLRATELSQDDWMPDYEEIVGGLLAEFGRRQSAPAEGVSLVEALTPRLPFLGPNGVKAVADAIEGAMEEIVGARLSEGLPQSDLDEFDAIGEEDEALRWLEEHCPGFAETEEFVRYAASTTQGGVDDWVSGYARVRWLAIHRPDYRTIVADAISDLAGRVDELVALVGPDGLAVWLYIQMITDRLGSLDLCEPLPAPDSNWIVK